MNKNANIKLAISLSGGGSRGALETGAMEAIEKLYEKPIQEKFHAIAGTSTGGIIAAGIACGYSPHELAELYIKKAPQIFSKPFWKSVVKGFGILDERYNSQNLLEALDDYFGQKWLSETEMRLLITAFDMVNQYNFIFDNQKSKKTIGYDFPLKEVCSATSAASTYFEPVLATSKAGISYALVDGGMAGMNNPSQVLMNVLKKDEENLNNWRILSLGTGWHRGDFNIDKAKNWGVVKWIVPIIDALMNGAAYGVVETSKTFLGENYIHLDTFLPKDLSAMDISDTSKLRKLHEIGYDLVMTHKEALLKWK